MRMLLIMAACLCILPLSGNAQRIPKPTYNVVGNFCPNCQELIPGATLPSKCPHCGFSFSGKPSPSSPSKKGNLVYPWPPSKPQLQPVDPYAGYLFYDVPLRPEDGKLKPVHLDPDGLAARAEATGNEMRQRYESRQQEQQRKFEMEKEALLKNRPEGTAMGQLRNVFADESAWDDAGTVDLRHLKDGTGTVGLLRNAGESVGDLQAAAEQSLFENDNPAWIENQKELFQQRLQEPNRDATAIYKSLLTKAPPPLPGIKYENLLPGDVLLFSKNDTKSFFVNLADRVSSGSDSPASHTVVYLKEVKGKKLFLDNTLGRGVHVIGEEEFFKTYGGRDALAGSVAQPITEREANLIWEAAKEAVKTEASAQQKKSGNVLDQTGYGLYGDDNTVCSEASRWALIKAGRDIPVSASPLKHLFGIHYGPANIYSDKFSFIITPLRATEKPITP